MPKKAISRIKFEIDQIDRLLESYDDLFSQIQSEPPNLVEITALGAVIHSFYNGLENIFLIVAKRIDKQLPQGEEWHRQILQQMKTPTFQRPPIIQPETAVLLADYLAFRHFF